MMEKLFFSLVNEFVFAVVAPPLLIILGAYARRLVRGSAWRWEDWFWGVELAFAALAAVLAHACHIVSSAAAEVVPLDNPTEWRSGHDLMVPQAELGGTCVLALVTFVLLTILLALHRDYLRPEVAKKQRDVVLGICSNAVGGILLFGMIYLSRR